MNKLSNKLDFKRFVTLLQENVRGLFKGKSYLYMVDIDKDKLWNTYLSNFNEEERWKFNCSPCRQFIKNYGNIVVIEGNKLRSIWGFKVDDSEYQLVLDELNDLVIISKIKDVFITTRKKLGVSCNHQYIKETSTSITWNHLHIDLNDVNEGSYTSYFIRGTGSDISSIQAKYRDSRNVFKRALEEITIDATDIVLELIAQNSLYRGYEFKYSLESFLSCQRKYLTLNEEEREIYTWEMGVSLPPSISRIRNTAIGTLLINVSNNPDFLDEAVGQFEKMMAPTNYKRPNTIISKSMVDEAYRKVKGLGLESSLARRYAVSDDLTVNNVLYLDRNTSTKSSSTSSIFNEIKEDIPVSIGELSKVESIDIDDFIKEIIPKSNEIELLLEERHEGNLVSLIAPANMDSPSLFKWDNGFSWSYNNDLADSMKERVKKAGGNINGVLRFSIEWNHSGVDNVDFDNWTIEPNGNRIGYSSYRYPSISPSSGSLDVDIIDPKGKIAVENQVWTDLNKMGEGIYTHYVHNYSPRNSSSGFKAELEYDGHIYSFEYPHSLKGKERVDVIRYKFSKTKGIEIIDSLSSTNSSISKEMWSISTNKFHKVNMICYSPNYWDGQLGIGNKHYFFMLNGCKSTQSRGFFNEMLKEDLIQHRKVFEALGIKMKVPYSDNQLSGLGFSSTQRNEFIVKIKGKFTRHLKVVI